MGKGIVEDSLDDLSHFLEFFIKATILSLNHSLREYALDKAFHGLCH